MKTLFTAVLTVAIVLLLLLGQGGDRGASPAQPSPALTKAPDVSATESTAARPRTVLPANAASEDQPSPAADPIEDPVARQIPLLFGLSKQRQLELLRWLQHVPEDKVVSAVPSVAYDRSRPVAQRREQALEIIGQLIDLLEAEGVEAPTLPDDFVAAQTVDGQIASGEHGSDRALGTATR